MIKHRLQRFALLVTLIGSVACGAKPHKDSDAIASQTVEWSDLIAMPSLSLDYGQGVSGHYAGTLITSTGKELVWIAGGSNFPEISAAEGGAKRFYSDIYTAERISTDSLRWCRAGQLPDSVAYSAWLPTPTGAIIAGGQGINKDLRAVYRLEVYAPDSVALYPMPELPEPRSGASMVRSGSSYYIIGGKASGKLSNTMLRLETDGKEKCEWQSMAAYPGPPLMKTLTWGTPQYIYLVGSVAHSEEAEKPAKLLLSFFRYSIQRDVWEQLTFPDSLLALGMSLGGGMVYQSDERSAILMGGVHTERFLPAIHRSQLLRLASINGNSNIIDSLKRENYMYLTHPRDWYQFATSVWHWQASPNIPEGIWTRLPHSIEGRADAVLTRANTGEYLLVSGEEKPGIRSKTILKIKELLK